MKTKILVSAIALLASSASMANSNFNGDNWLANLIGTGNSENTYATGTMNNTGQGSSNQVGKSNGGMNSKGSAPSEFVSSGGGFTMPSVGAKTNPTMANDAKYAADVNSAFTSGYTNGFKDGAIALKQKIDSALKANNTTEAGSTVAK
jgi:hypothetical protein